MIAGARGFTLVELVTIIIILGILAVVAIPRMDTSVYRVTEFHDQTVAALRFAQKTAVSHRRTVCVSFPDNHSLALRVATQWHGACDADLSIPGATSNQVVSSDQSSAHFVTLPTAWSFASDGTSSDCRARTGGNCIVSIDGAAAITVVGATGYVQ